MSRVFVYGTLKKGGSNHRLLAGQSFVGNASTLPGYALFELDGYPGMVEEAGAPGTVTGEIWDVDTEALERLDRLEGTQEGLYERKAVRLAHPFEDGTIEAYFYLRSLEGRRRLSGTWLV